MNWLAHLFLSEPTAEFRIGNILPDLLPPTELRNLPAAFASGVACHRAIDAFTDSDPIVKRSIARLNQTHRRYGGIIIDVFYDHFLAAEWNTYSHVPFESFLRQAYGSIGMHRGDIPLNAFAVLQQMSREDWLGSYRNSIGIRDALNRIGRRLRKPLELGGSVGTLERLRPEFREDFAMFFPKLVAHIGSRL